MFYLAPNLNTQMRKLCVQLVGSCSSDSFDEECLDRTLPVLATPKAITAAPDATLNPRSKKGDERGGGWRLFRMEKLCASPITKPPPPPDVKKRCRKLKFSRPGWLVLLLLLLLLFGAYEPPVRNSSRGERQNIS